MNTQGVVQVIVSNQDVTTNVKENGAGIDVEISQPIEIQFVNEQTIDSVVILPESNVESYYISYEKLDGDVYVLDDVKFLFFLFFVNY